VQAEVKDVLEQTHKKRDDGESVDFRIGRLRAALSRRDKAQLDGGVLSIGDRQFPIDPKQAKKLTLLAPNQVVIADVIRGLASRRPTLVSAAAGSGAACTIRWLLESNKARHDFVRLDSSTSLDSLAGLRRPDEKNNFFVNDGPLTRCVRDGGVLVIDGLERADEEILAALKALAKGAEVFHHPVSGEPIKVDPNFKLVLITDASKEAPSDLVRVANVTEIPPYDPTEQAKLLEGQYGLPADLSRRLARFVEDLRKAANDGDLPYGQKFPIGWTLLEKVARRLSPNANPGAIQDALIGVFGMRLPPGEPRAVFDSLLEKHQLGAEVRSPRTRIVSEGFVDLPHQREALHHGKKALDAGEVVLLHGPGQAGVTRLVEELAAQRKQEVVTIPGHSQCDAAMLLETPRLTKEGILYYEPGRLTQALLSGALVYVDHVDHMSPERQNAFFQVMKSGKVTVLENGRLVEKPIHKRAAIVLSSTEGSHSSRMPPDPSDRAGVTEIQLTAPAAEDALALARPLFAKKPALLPLFEETFRALADPPGLLSGVTQLQRALDFARAAMLLTEVMGPASALRRAAELVLEVPGDHPAIATLLAKAKDENPQKGPIWHKLLKLDGAVVKARLEGGDLEITPSMEPHLDVMAIAYRLQRPVIMRGPASSGKTVLGALFAKLTDMDYVRVNFSSDTEARTLLGGPGASTVDGKIVIADLDGPWRRATRRPTVLANDEDNLHRDIHMLAKSMADYRGELHDAESNQTRSFRDSFLILSGNRVDAKTGRSEPPPTFTDSTFHLEVEAKPTEERIDLVKKRTGMSREQVAKVVHFFQDFEHDVSRSPDAFRPASGPLTFTERDMLKGLAVAEHMIARDRIVDPAEQQVILAREVLRVAFDVVQSPLGRERVLKLIRTAKHFGPNVAPPERPRNFERVVIKGVEYLQIGAARLKVMPMPKKKELLERIPKSERLRAPLGVQLEFLESLALALETGQPAAVVGATGTGKTMLVQWLAHQLNMPMREQPCYGEMRPEDLIGSTVIDAKGQVDYEYAAMSWAAKNGGWAVLDEYLTAPNAVRESGNPVTEGSEIQIHNKRPPETIAKKDWASTFRLIVTTNGGDIREDDFSAAEASRFRLIGVHELETVDDYRALARRDYAHPLPDYAAPKAGEKAAAFDGLVGLLDKRSKVGRLFAEALAHSRGEGPAPDLEALVMPVLDKDRDLLIKTFADFFSLADAPKAQPLVELADRLLSAQAPELAMAVRCCLKGGVPPLSASRAEAAAVVEGRLFDPSEAERGAELFIKLRDLSRAAKVRGLSPLTPRIFTSFLDLYVSLRRQVGSAEAAARAAELALWSKLPPGVEKKALAAMVESFGQRGDERVVEAPRTADDGVWFGTTRIPFGTARPWAPDVARFPVTHERRRNLALLADALALGQGRPIACTDDANGETLEELRELGRRTGRPVTVVTLAPNVDLEALIEKYGRSDGAEAIAGFAGVLQQIGQAVRDGHLLVIRGANNVPTTVLERLNSLGDGNQGIRLPRSKRWLQAHADFRMVLMKTPGANKPFSPALENRLLEPLLSTREGTNTSLESRAAELAEIVHRRTGISEGSAMRLAVFHTYLNDVLREKGLSGALNIGSLLNRDAEAVARRLAVLKRPGSIEDETELLHHLLLSHYGERFDSAHDRGLIAEIAGIILDGVDSSNVKLSSELSLNPGLLRFGPWAVQRDARGLRRGVPGAHEMLPFGESETLTAVQQRIFPALQFDEVLYLHGDETVAMACIKGTARMTGSQVFEVEASEKLSEAFLFGGLIQEPKTGEWKEHKGLLWHAQEEGGTLVIKDAGKLPPAILTQLSEIAATGHLTRTHDGQLETRPRNFRLVFHSEESYLPFDLASLATRVRIPPIESPEELQQILSHILVGVPGGAELAELLRSFGREAERLVEGEDQSGRQRLRFDSSRLFSAARELAAAVREGQGLEDALADVITRLYLAPARGLAAEEGLRASLEDLAADLKKVLIAELPQLIDHVERPQLAALDLDYRRASGALTQVALQSAKQALERGRIAGDAAQLLPALVALGRSKVVPDAVARRAAKAAEILAADPGDPALLGRELKAVSTIVGEHLVDDDAPELRGVLLDFLRGARLWDLEHRLTIVDQYQELLVGLEGPRGDRAELVREARGRFNGAGALQRVEQMRVTVGDALDAYKNRRGENDERLAQLFRELIEKWDAVATSPIFRDDLLRSRLGELEALLDEIQAAHDNRAQEGNEVERLLGALRSAGQTLEGLRLAEQSVELRRDLDRTAKDAAALFDSMKKEVLEIRRLEEAEDSYRQLVNARGRLQGVRENDLFIKLRFDGEVARPDVRSEGELAAKASAEAEVLVAAEVQAEHLRLAAEVQRTMDASAPVNPAAMYQGFDPVAAGLVPGPMGAERPVLDPVAQSQAQLEGQLSTFGKKRQALHERKILERLKQEEEQRATRTYQDRVRNRANEIAARVNKTVADLAGELEILDRSLRLAERAPKLHAELLEVRAEVAAAVKEARHWATKLVDFATAAGRTLLDGAIFTLDVFSFGLFGLSKKRRAAEAEQAPTLDLVPTQQRAAKLLDRVHDWLTAEIEALPDFKRMPVHREATINLEAELLAATKLGELASRYAKLTEYFQKEDNQVFRRYLSQLLDRLGGARDTQEILQRVQAFTDSADLLSNEIAGRGVALELAPVVESVMKAAETLRAQSLKDQTYRLPVRQLRQAIQNIDALGAPEEQPPVLRAVRQEMEKLVGLLTAGADGPLRDRTEEAALAFTQLLSRRGRTSSELEDDDDHVHEDERTLEVRDADRDRATAPTARAEQSLSALPTGGAPLRAVDQRRRADELVVIHIESNPVEVQGATGLPVAEGEAPPPPDEALLALRARAAAAAGKLDTQVKKAIGGLPAQKKVLLEVLGQLEAQTRVAALDQWREQLAGLAGHLEAVAVGGADPRQAQIEVARAVSGLRAAVRGLQGLECLAPAALAQLEVVLSRTGALAQAFGSELFRAKAEAWGADALLALRETEAQLLERRGALEAEVVKPKAAGELLERLSTLGAWLAKDESRIGAYSRFQLLAHLHQRLSGVVEVLPKKALPEAHALLVQVEGTAELMRQRSGGLEGDQTAADLHGAYLDLGRALAVTKSEQAPVEAYENLGALLWGLLGGGKREPAPLLDRYQTTIEVLQALEAKVKGPGRAAATEMIRAVHELRSQVMNQELSGHFATWNQTTGESIDRLRDLSGNLAETARRFVSYDPLSEPLTVGELADALTAVLKGLDRGLVGPGAALLAGQLVNLDEKLQLLAETPNELGRRARLLAGRVTELLAGLKVLQGSELMPRFAELTRTAHQTFEEARQKGVSRETLSWAEKLVGRLPELLEAPPARVLEVFGQVEADLFPELVQRRERVEQRARTITAEAEAAAALPKVESQVAELLRREQQTATVGVGAGKVRTNASASAGGAAGLGASIGAPIDSPVLSLLSRRRAPLGVASVEGGTILDSLVLEGRPRGPHLDAPDPTDAPIEPGRDPGTGSTARGKVLDRDARLGAVKRNPLPSRPLEERSKPLQGLELTKNWLQDHKKALDQAVKEAQAALRGSDQADLAELNDYQLHKEENRDRIAKMAGILRALGNVELLVLVDQSGSTSDAFGEHSILDMERAGASLLMGAVQQSESNCAIFGFGARSIGRDGMAPVAQSGRFFIFPHKSMAEPLDDSTGDAVFGMLSESDGGTDIDVALDVVGRPEMFSATANHKAVVLFTDAQVGNPEEVRQKIAELQHRGIPVVLVCMGDEGHARAIDPEGEFAISVRSLDEMLTRLPSVFQKTLTQHAKAQAGHILGSAAGIGVADGHHPLQAPGAASLNLVDNLHQPLPEPQGDGGLVVPTGERREQRNLVDRQRYEQAKNVLRLERAQRRGTPELKRAKVEILGLAARQSREGISQTLRQAFFHGMPRARGSEMEKRQFSGPYFDEDQLPLYLIGLAQGVPELRLFKRRKPVGKSQSRLVINADISTSTSRPEVRRAMIESIIAEVDAYKDANPGGQVAIISSSDKVRLHQAFDMDWNDEAKAHLLMELNESHPATDDERGDLEAIGLLDLMGTDVGMILTHTDGQGMPGAVDVTRSAAQRGYGMLNVGVGADCRSVVRFGEHGLYARNVSQMAHRFWDSLLKVWESAGRVVQ
jgi:nitric oxide reductase NorQ protein